MFPPGDTVGRLMELNCFSPELNFDFLPSYDEWLVNNSFNPFDSEPSSPISSPSPAIPSHLRPNVELRTEEDGVVNHDHGHSEVTMQIYLKDRSRFGFAQNPAGETFGTKAAQSRRREPALASPEIWFHLPKGLTCFGDFEEELLAGLCLPSERSVSPASAMVGAELPSEHALGPPPDMSSWMGSVSSEEDHESFEFDPDRVLLGSEILTPGGFGTRMSDFEWSTPYQGHQVVTNLKGDGDVGLSTIVILPR